jgi:hypothetical protein
MRICQLSLVVGNTPTRLDLVEERLEQAARETKTMSTNLAMDNDAFTATLTRA